MTKSHTFSAQARTLVGKKVKQLRSQNLVPANVINGGETSVAISFPFQEFVKLYRQVGDTGLVYLEIEGEKKPRPVLVEDAAVDPLTGLVTHVVFKQVNLKEKIEAEVPIEVVGEADIANAVVLTVANSVDVEALPTDLPEKFVVDISTLTEIGQSITFAQLEFDSSKITLKIEEEEMNNPIVLVQEVKEEVEEAPAEEVAAEGDTATAGETADNAESTDGATTEEEKKSE